MNKFLELRNELKLSQQEVADLLKVKIESVILWERGAGSKYAWRLLKIKTDGGIKDA